MPVVASGVDVAAVVVAAVFVVVAAVFVVVAAIVDDLTLTSVAHIRFVFF